ncbi:hypothetical protein GobsT_18510 [Gemmata obscuriglobus]|nr:hypothetical protein GobsT_18510 [Gemmata obscuriglobus]VTS03589.1 unnamed protein product [Gemmata obscuriglobus UQM 2246]
MSSHVVWSALAVITHIGLAWAHSCEPMLCLLYLCQVVQDFHKWRADRQGNVSSERKE